MSLQVWLPLNRDLRNHGACANTWYNTNSSAISVSNYCYNFSGYSGIGISNAPSSGGNEVSAEFFSKYINNHSFSIAIWINTTAAPTSNGMAIITFGYGIAFKLLGDGKPMIYLTGSDGGSSTVGGGAIATSVVNDGKWHHLVATYDVDANVIKFYVDGVLEKTGSYASGYKFVGKWTNNITIGKDINASTQNNRYYYQGSLYDFRFYDHALSQKEVTELSRGCILHYPCNDILNESTVNLVSSITAGGQTTVSNGVVTTSGVNADTYFTLNLSESITEGTQYTISCEAEFPEGTNWIFPIGGQSNTALSFNIKNGYNEYTFVANNFNFGTNRCFMDDTNGTAKTSGVSCKLWNFQLEKKDHATVYTPSSRTQTHLKDVSGFDNHSTITGSLPLVTTQKSARYDKCMDLTNGRAIDTINAPQIQSASFWIYIGDSIYSATTNAIVFRHISGIAFGFYSGNSVLIHNGDSEIPCYWNITSKVKYNSWNHFAINHYSNNTDLFINGIKYTNGTSTRWSKTSNNFELGKGTSTVHFPGLISDFRLFSKILTQADVVDLYKDSLSIDKSQNAFTYELNESDFQTTVDVKKNGQLACKNFSETLTSAYDDNAYMEPDGSVWIRIFHHNNPSGGLFSSSDTFDTKVYKDANRWFNVSVCNNVNKWELMVKLKGESSSTELKYRWILNANPMIATWDLVKYANITPITTSGYISSTYGGIWLRSTSYTTNTYLCAASGSSSGWWCATGSWTGFGSYSGIPGYDGVTINSGYLDLYLRIDNIDTYNNPVVKNINVETYIRKYNSALYYDEGELETDYYDYFCYDGETVIYNDKKCYVWNRYENGELYEDYTDDDYICKLLTNTLDIKGTINSLNSAFEAFLTNYDDDVQYINDYLEWGLNEGDLPLLYQGKRWLERNYNNPVGDPIYAQVPTTQESHTIARIGKTGVIAGSLTEI